MKDNSYHLKEMQVLGLKAQYFLHVLKSFGIRNHVEGFIENDVM